MEERLLKILRLAIKYKASDIHFSCKYSNVEIYMRINNVPKKLKSVEGDDKLIRYLQYRSNLDIGKLNEPQTGQFEIELDNNILSLRFALINSYNSSNGVLRILNSNINVNVDNLSSEEKQNEYFKSLLRKNNGLIIFSGPTGSGKTTTLYTLLKSVENRIIYTIEDPIEVYIDKFTQIQINEKIGLDYETGIKQIMRHDSDIIMIGEIRDTKAAKMANFFGSLTAGYAADTMGSGYTTMVLTVLTMFIGLFTIIGLDHKKVKGSVLYGILVGSIFYWACEYFVLHTNPFASLSSSSWLPPFKDMAALTLFKFDFNTLKSLGVFTTVTLVLTFCIIDMFDTIGTLVGTASRANMLDKDGNMPNMKEALISDAVGTVVGAVTGTSTITTFVESASGVEAGGRTGLTSLVTGLLFLASMFISPIAAIIPAAATSSALIYVGTLMLQGLKNIDFDDISVTIPVFIMLVAMPISGSIGHGIGLGLISYTIIKLITGKFKEVSVLTLVLSIIFLVKFFLVV